MKGACDQYARGRAHLQEREEGYRDTGHSLRSSPRVWIPARWLGNKIWQ